jgi:AcrR family transcriptional regulator
MPRSKAPRLGRPPASSAVETRQRILEVACEQFSTLGYGVTTNKDVAVQAGITTGALYYYFDSKLDMYLAVFRHLQQKIDERFASATADQDTFDGKLRAILEAAFVMNVEDPSIARFQGAARTDRARHPELREAIANAPGEGAGLLPGLIATGLATGEIAPGRKDEVAAVVRTMFVGLVDALSQNPAEQRKAIDGIHALLDGTLLRPAKPKPKRRAG